MDPKTLMVVDDSENLRQLMRDLLEAMDHSVIVAGDAFDAYHLLKTHPETALVFLDVYLPFTRGTALLEKIKASLPEVKVVLITGTADDDLVSQTMSPEAQASAEGFITKPFTIDDLAACIERVLVHGKKYLAHSPYLKKLAGRRVTRQQRSEEPES